MFASGPAIIQNSFGSFLYRHMWVHVDMIMGQDYEEEFLPLFEFLGMFIYSIFSYDHVHMIDGIISIMWIPLKKRKEKKI